MAEKSDEEKISQAISSFIAPKSYVYNPKEIVEISSDEENDSDALEIVVNASDPEKKNSPEHHERIVSSPHKKDSNSSENFSATTDFQEIQNINESIICERDVENLSKNVTESDNCRFPKNMHLNDAPEECILVNNLVTNSVSVSNELEEYDLCSNDPEKFIVKNNIETTVINMHELPSDNSACNDAIDMSDKVNEYSCYKTEYDMTRPPSQITGTWTEFNSVKNNNFTKGCKWAPDGSCILTCNDDNKLRLYNLPQHLFDSSQWSHMPELDAVLRISEGDLVYDYCWYPLMNSNVPSTCCFASTSRKSTVHLWDAYTGELRCSYRSYSHLDELVTPHSISFDNDGEKLFCGFQNVIRVFDVSRPGRTFEERQIYAYKTGQSGIISCFAFTSVDKNISAAGSYQKSIGLYAEPCGELSCLLEGPTGGITHLQFSPDGKFLYSGGRKDPEILCWDLRMLGTVLFSLKRSCKTNQRMYFDVSRCGKYVVSGNQNGIVTFWDVTKDPKIMQEDEYPVLFPERFFVAHQDCVNGVSLHPFYPVLCSSSGQRKFPVLLDDDSDAMFSSDIDIEDNSLRLWWIGKKI